YRKKRQFCRSCASSNCLLSRCMRTLCGKCLCCNDCRKSSSQSSPNTSTQFDRDEEFSEKSSPVQGSFFCQCCLCSKHTHSNPKIKFPLSKKEQDGSQFPLPLGTPIGQQDSGGLSKFLSLALHYCISSLFFEYVSE
ncbi:hypothetical protein Ciccas_011170, partial [Cichlidogyrus casuarinus]